jgi:hypothetical protein
MDVRCMAIVANRGAILFPLLLPTLCEGFDGGGTGQGIDRYSEGIRGETAGAGASELVDEKESRGWLAIVDRDRLIACCARNAMQIPFGTAQFETSLLEVRLPAREVFAESFHLTFEESVFGVEAWSVVSAELIEGKLIHTPVGHQVRERFEVADVRPGEDGVDSQEGLAIDAASGDVSNDPLQAIEQPRHRSQGVMMIAFTVDADGDFLHQTDRAFRDARVFQRKTVGGRAHAQAEISQAFRYRFPCGPLERFSSQERNQDRAAGTLS